jgi:thioredoxin-related protein
MLKSLTVGLALVAAPAMAATLGDDGLHKAPWIIDTFKDLREDLAEADAEGKRLMVIIEQRGCIYCSKMHEEVFVLPVIEKMLTNDFYVVQLNMFGDVEVNRWNMLFTPTMMFMPESVPNGVTAPQAAVATVPGAFGKFTTFNMLNWVKDHGYDSDEPFQKYHARMIEAGFFIE